MSAIDDITIDVSVVLGSAQIPISQILRMGRGAMIALDCGHDDPTLLYVNGKLVAKGTVLVNEDQMSIEINHVVRKGQG
ncbi:flagellar motor switch protein FliN/FliY [Sphingomonas sp. SORGH_AS802]|jgi:flagellar motor switch protein FliN/FliY|uniref:FliM/FliN family flagellar motor switch protein n=1 Tax=unclassified Sphingomonas TaxID=196159 RepID=UPI000F7F7B00|nr:MULTISPECIES: FliM/FliN family flagellar motor switch protein [unclassified Sphingomonas]MDR6134011.1 flagellar motor switch protein FliN/FliY [Sphingomonas sp. SORGH_AS_0802]RSU47002.1 flagellar motor switch protein FliN [Sphingomonas sp. S-NIH.Pt15_0812]